MFLYRLNLFVLLTFSTSVWLYQIKTPFQMTSIATHLRLLANNKSKNAGRPYTFAVHFAVHFRRIVSAKRPHTFDYKTVYFRFLRTEYFYYIFSSRTVYFQSGLYTSHITRISCNYNVERKNNLFNGDTAVEPQRPYTFIC